MTRLSKRRKVNLRQEYYAEIIADSEINNNRITTFEITFPRFIAEQLLTHRMLSRNAGSLRATPTKKIITTTTVEPLRFSANQPGMSAGADLLGAKAALARAGWEVARTGARIGARLLNWAGCHKEITNRVLAPFLWQTFVVTSNSFGWENFFKQRCSEHAQPEIAKIAGMMFNRYKYPRQYTAITYQHIPYDPLFEDAWPDWTSWGKDYTQTRKQISVARIARVSLFNHGSSRIDYDKDIALYDKLKHSEHYSPFDHVLTYNREFVNGIYPGWRSLREELFPQFIQER